MHTFRCVTYCIYTLICILLYSMYSKCIKYTSTELACENKYVVRHVRKLSKYCDYATKLFLILILVCYLTVFLLEKFFSSTFFYSNSTFSISFIVSTFHCPKVCSIRYISIFIYTLMTMIMLYFCLLYQIQRLI